MSKPEQPTLDEWDEICAAAHKAILDGNSLTGDGTLAEMHKYIHELEKKCEELEDDVSHWICRYQDASYDDLEEL